MLLDVPTLFTVAIFLTALLGTLLLFAWIQNRRTAALAWWGGGELAASLATAMLVGRGALSNFVSIDLANALMLAAYGVFWTGMRRFERRPALLVPAMAGAALWLLACQIPAFYSSAGARIVFCSIVAAAYTLAAAQEIWRGRAEMLHSRYPILVVLAVHAAFYLIRVPATFTVADGPGATLHSLPWAAAICFELLLYVVVMSFLLLGLTKERVEREQRLMATRDPLTGILNRRALFDDASLRLARDLAAGRRAALLLLDIDHFKRVNDRHGHSVGDRVLCGLCREVAAHLPARAHFARLGGEEFACVLPGRDADEALLVAENIRIAVENAILVPGLPELRATISIGLADTDEAGHDLEALLAAADLNLYRAKRAGRNRIEHCRPIAAQAA